MKKELKTASGLAAFIMALALLLPFTGCRLREFAEAFDPGVTAVPRNGAPAREDAAFSAAPTGVPSADATCEAPTELPSQYPFASESAAPASAPAVSPTPGGADGSAATPKATPAPGAQTPSPQATRTPSPAGTPRPTQRPTVTTPKPEPIPTSGYLTDWEKTRLVNFMHLLPDDFVPHDLINAQSYLGTLCTYHNTRARIQTEVAVQTKRMFEAAYSEGVTAKYYLRCAYRTQASQWELWNDRLSHDPHYGDDPYAKPVGTMPGNASEHCAGLALDITSTAHPEMDYGFGQTSEGIWLRNNAYRFGFILRYPANKAHITGVHYESWHFRYVGVELARELHSRGVCLEEYYGEIHGSMPAPTPQPTAHPTAHPTVHPTAAPTVHPTAAPTAGHTAAPTTGPTATPAPTPTHTPAATPEPTPRPTFVPPATPSPEPEPTDPE